MDRQKAWDELDRESRDVKIDIRSLMRGTPQSLLERPLPGQPNTVSPTKYAEETILARSLKGAKPVEDDEFARDSARGALDFGGPGASSAVKRSPGRAVSGPQERDRGTPKPSVAENNRKA